MEKPVYRSCVVQLHTCKAICCHNGVWVDAEEAKEIERQVLAEASLKDLHGKTLFGEEDNDPEYFPTGKGVGTALRTPEGPCLFLGDDYKCRIYAFRPFFCRDYPLMHPISTSKESVIIDNMFEKHPECIYHDMIKATNAYIREEAEKDDNAN